jgi:hypothetical protein
MSPDLQASPLDVEPEPSEHRPHGKHWVDLMRAATERDRAALLLKVPHALARQWREGFQGEPPPEAAPYRATFLDASARRDLMIADNLIPVRRSAPGLDLLDYRTIALQSAEDLPRLVDALALVRTLPLSRTMAADERLRVVLSSRAPYDEETLYRETWSVMPLSYLPAAGVDLWVYAGGWIAASPEQIAHAMLHAIERTPCDHRRVRGEARLRRLWTTGDPRPAWQGQIVAWWRRWQRLVR